MTHVIKHVPVASMFGIGPSEPIVREKSPVNLKAPRSWLYLSLYSLATPISPSLITNPPIQICAVKYVLVPLLYCRMFCFFSNAPQLIDITIVMNQVGVHDTHDLCSCV